IALTRAEASLLTELARSPCMALSREKLRRDVAGRSAEAFERSIDMVVTRLRRKIEPNPRCWSPYQGLDTSLRPGEKLNAPSHEAVVVDGRLQLISAGSAAAIDPRAGY